MFVPNTARLSGHFTSLNPNLWRSQAKVYVFLSDYAAWWVLGRSEKIRRSGICVSSWKNTASLLITSKDVFYLRNRERVFLNSRQWVNISCPVPPCIFTLNHLH